MTDDCPITLPTLSPLRDGDAAAAGPSAARFERDDLAEGAFYRTLKGRVEAYFKANKLDPRSSIAFNVKAALIMLAFAALYYAMFFEARLGFGAAAVAAVAFGFIKAQVKWRQRVGAHVLHGGCVATFKRG